eukprot:TRINITY_DN49_c0_g1_i1.p1 TRINITY_DN49_c0_g1~~TRINITY_DN49_c0_g1_i1.p1  ORF type:complete len:165 (+),score=32.25 TRINITY_DN49_c0_g1_i1:212-706(+)
MKPKPLIVLLVLLLFSFCSASSISFEQNTQPISELCNVPSDVAFCMDVMRVGTRFNDPTAEHFARLETQLSEHALEECSWESFEGRKTPGECIATLSRFAEQNVDIGEMENDLEPSERILDKFCYKGCKAIKCLKCKFKPTKKKRKKCKKKCKKKCRKKCDKIF